MFSHKTTPPFLSSDLYHLAWVVPLCPFSQSGIFPFLPFFGNRSIFNEDPTFSLKHLSTCYFPDVFSSVLPLLPALSGFREVSPSAPTDHFPRFISSPLSAHLWVVLRLRLLFLNKFVRSRRFLKRVCSFGIIGFLMPGTARSSLFSFSAGAISYEHVFFLPISYYASWRVCLFLSPNTGFFGPVVKVSVVSRTDEPQFPP